MKRLLSVVLAGLMLVGGTASLASSANGNGEVKKSEPFIHGYLDKSFAPEKSITRAEAVKMFVAATEIEKTSEGIEKFADLKDGGHWASEYIGAAVKEGLINGKPDRNFYPDQNITRAELITIVSKSIKDGNSNTNKVKGFIDLEESHWSFSFVIRAAKFGYIEGYADGSLKVDQEITRSEATKLINTRLGRIADKIDTSKLVNKFTDMDDENWAYKDVLLGSNNFDYKIEKGKFIIVKSNEPKAEAAVNTDKEEPKKEDNNAESSKDSKNEKDAEDLIASVIKSDMKSLFTA